MNLGAFKNPEFPIFSTTLCYLERDDAYLMPPYQKAGRLQPRQWIGGGESGVRKARRLPAASEGGDWPDAESASAPGVWLTLI